MSSTAPFRTLLFATVLAAAFAVAARGGTREEDDEDARDPRVRDMLTAADLRFSTDGDGDYSVRFRIGEGRPPQSVLIRSETARLLDLEMRDLVSVGLSGSGEPPEGLFDDLLLRNAQTDLGDWEWAAPDDDGDWAVLFRAKVPARMTPASFKAALRLVARTAADFAAEHAEGGRKAPSGNNGTHDSPSRDRRPSGGNDHLDGNRQREKK